MKKIPTHIPAVLGCGIGMILIPILGFTQIGPGPMPSCGDYIDNAASTQNICKDRSEYSDQTCSTLLWHYTRSRGVTKREYQHGNTYTCDPWEANGCCSQYPVTKSPECPASTCAADTAAPGGL